MMICILFTVAAVSAADNQTDILSEEDSTFTDLSSDINGSGEVFEVHHDYKYGGDDNFTQIALPEKNLTINGNNHKIDASGKSGIFKASNLEEFKNKLTINDLTFFNCSATAINSIGYEIVLNNVTFIYNNPNENIINIIESQLTINNCHFKSASAQNVVHAISGTNVIIRNSVFSDINSTVSHITVNRGDLIVENCTFNNITSTYGGAVEYRGGNLTVKKSKFFNLHAMTGGAILGKFVPNYENGNSFGLQPILIGECSFENVSASHNGGAVLFDLDSRAGNITKTLNIYSCNFTNCSSDFGGAIVHAGGILNISDSIFENNYANYKGGAVYAAFTNLILNNTRLNNNSAKSAGGAIYFDNGKLLIITSNLTNNTSNNPAAAIYANEADTDFENSLFDNNGISVYGVFIKSHTENNIISSDEFSWNNTNYIVFVENEGIKITLLNSDINVNKLPTRFDSREWGWITSIKDQGNANTCWTFSVLAALESSLLKSTGVLYDLSENNFKSLQMKYFPEGDLRNPEIGFAYSGLGYALSWYGVITESDDVYDERSIISDVISTENRIHIQDAMIIFGGLNNTNELLKQAILKYGGVSVQFLPDIAGELTGKFYNNESGYPDHFVTLIGWDDNYAASNFGDSLSTPGAWIIKNSWGSDNNNDGYGYISYADVTFMSSDEDHTIVPQRAAVAFIFENDIDYHVNYQTDLTGLTGFDGSYTYYSNEFTSQYSELIGAVGTYFNESGIDYSFDVYVNGVKVHTQTGVSEFAGFRTIVLNKYIPVKSGDTFKVVFKNNALPYQAYSRQHYIQGMSMISSDGKTFEDISLVNKTVCLKVYTVADDTKIINNKNIAVDYTGGKYFSVKVITSDGRAVGAGAVVKFTINGKTYTKKTDSNGIAKIKITQLPKKYTIKTVYNGKTYKNTVTVKQVLTASKVTIKKSSKKLVLKAKLKINGKLVKGKVVKFKFKGKTYKVKTNKKGIAQKTLKKKVIKKLKKGKKYTVKVTYSKTTIKTTVKVKR